MASKETNVFISYRRMNGGTAYAYILNEYLSSLGIRCFYDIKSLQNYSQNFESEILTNIRKSDYVVVLLQDGCLTERTPEDYFLKEIRYARENGIELIMLPMGGDFVWEKQNNLPRDMEELKLLNLCTPIEMDNLQESMNTLLSMMKKDGLDRHYKMLSKIKNAQGSNKGTVLQRNHDISSVDISERWRKAIRVSLMAIGCSGVVARFDQTIKRLADKGTEFRFLAVDPEGASASDFTKNKLNGNTNGSRNNFLQENYATMLLTLGRIRTPHNSIEYRLTSDHITFTIHWVECENDAESYIFVEFLPVRTAGIAQDFHSAVLIKRSDPSYRFYSSQFEEIWAHSRIGAESAVVPGCEFCYPPAEDDKYILASTKYWRIYFANNQNYPARVIIPLLRHCERISDVTSQEMDELHQIVSVIENVWMEELGVVNFNWGCLMNTAYRQQPYIPHVHFHGIPRYDRPFATSEGYFTDEFFGHHYTISEEYQLPLKDRTELCERLKGILEEKLKYLTAK